MKPSTFLALFLITAATLAAALVSSMRGPSSAGDDRAGERLVPAVTQRANDITRIEVTDKGTTTVVARADSGWIMPAKADHPVRIEAVREAVGSIAQLRVVEAMTTQPDRFARLDVQDPASEGDRGKRVRLLRADGGVIADVIAGKSAPTTPGAVGAGGLFVRDAVENRAWLVQGQVQLPFDQAGWMDREITQIEADRVRSLTLDGGGKPPATLARPVDAGADQPAVTLQPMPEGRVLNDAEVSRALALFARLSFDDVIARGTLVADVEARRAEVITTDGLVVRLLPAKEGDRTVWLVAAEASEEAAKADADAINEKGRRFAYVLPKWKTDLIDMTPEQLTQPPKS